VIEELTATSVDIPQTPPELPISWRADHFSDTADLLEIQTLTTSIADIFNDFYEDGRIVGSLGQIDDLTPEIVTQMLNIEPSMVEYFEGEHLAAMSSDVFAVIPGTFLANLDGFTRDELAAAAIAESISGEPAQRESVALPDAWRIPPPELISFSFADIPLAQFSVAFTAVPVSDGIEDSETAENDLTNELSEAVGESVSTTSPEDPDAPALSPEWTTVGTFVGIELDTADDLLHVPDDFAPNVAGIINLIVAQPTAAPLVTPLLENLSVEVVEYILEHDPLAFDGLDPIALDQLQPEVAELIPESESPPPALSDAWDVLSRQSQFAEQPLATAEDVVTFGDGSPSSVLNTINADVPAQFEGYEVRLLDSLTPQIIAYFVEAEPDFYQNLDADVLRKLSGETLAAIPDDALETLDTDLAEMLIAIAEGEQDSAFATLQAEYTTNVAPADPDAPALQPAWAPIADNFGITG
jgi:hypothetical protein